MMGATSTQYRNRTETWWRGKDVAGSVKLEWVLLKFSVRKDGMESECREGCYENDGMKSECLEGGYENLTSLSLITTQKNADEFSALNLLDST